MDTRTLYGLDKKGEFKVWVISTFGTALAISHGKEGGKMTTKTEDFTEGKQGRSASEQAAFEAESRYKKQMDKGYRPTKEELTELPLLPMLAHDYLKQGHRIQYPCFGSPKLDGVRCLAIRHADRVELKSRGGKEYNVPHLQEQLLRAMKEGEVWDGEVYVHGYCLEEIVSAVKREDAREKAEKLCKKWMKSDDQEDREEYEAALCIAGLREELEFVIFDIVSTDDYHTRLGNMVALRRYRLAGMEDVPNIQVIQFCELQDEAHMKVIHKQYVNVGYEGTMLRNYGGKYESGKRSADLQKYKEFFEQEFRVTAVREDRNGNAVLELYDHVAKASFETTYGDFAERKRQLSEPDTVVGRALTVKFQTRYKDSLLPQFPTGVIIREGYWVGDDFHPTM